MYFSRVFRSNWGLGTPGLSLYVLPRIILHMVTTMWMIMQKMVLHFSNNERIMYRYRKITRLQIGIPTPSHLYFFQYDNKLEYPVIQAFFHCSCFKFTEPLFPWLKNDYPPSINSSLLLCWSQSSSPLRIGSRGNEWSKKEPSSLGRF